ncbi:MAG: HAD family phosphatase [Deltaproteobacteria bacterium]|nr:HAD family phosphatase [Deltaproteobacteria bacterium]
MTSFRAALFDFDGVIGDTMHDNFHAWQHALAAVEINLDQHEYFMLEGKRTIDLAQHLLRRHGRDVGLAEGIAIEKDRYYAAHNSFAFYPDAQVVVASLKQRGMKVGLVTGARRERAINERTTPFLSTFDTLVTSDDYGSGKPNPEPYLCAARKLEVSASDCVVIENAPLGVQAAKAAGMYCIGVTSTVDASYLEAADRVIQKIREVLDIIK